MGIQQERQARDLEISKMNIVPITIAKANAFVISFHRHNRPTVGGKWAIGLEHDEELVGVAIVGRPIARLEDQKFVAEVLRTCTNDKAPKGAVSKLYSTCWRIWQLMGGKKIITYTLLSESGASLRGAGWTVIGQVQPGTWDRKNRSREWQPIFGQQKLKWGTDRGTNAKA